MRVRLPFACAFVFLLLTSAYLGLSSLQIEPFVNDKVLHTVIFFILTTCFYWILDTTRRRNLNFTLLFCTGILGIGSEVLQELLPNGRAFDLLDIAANIVGSLAAVALSSWYHKRMLERKRAAKQYTVVPGEEEADLELGEGVGEQESGVVASGPVASLEEEVDNWDENAEDTWDDEGQAGTDSLEGEGPKTPSASSAGELETQPEPKKRVD
jgi:VanZ family protein